jgi:folylpolyglutamate synthase/dihydropteroate synthase
MVLGFVKRKEHQQIVNAFAPIAQHFQIVPLHSKRSIAPAELMRDLDWHNVPVARSAKLETGYRRVLKSAGPDDTICVIGSHYLVGEFLQKFGDGFGRKKR